LPVACLVRRGLASPRARAGLGRACTGGRAGQSGKQKSGGPHACGKRVVIASGEGDEDRQFGES
jgi:hypothetical protein